MTGEPQIERRKPQQRLRHLQLTSLAFVWRGDNPGAHITLKAVWSAAFVNKLPDSSFAYIEPGGEKDAEDKTTPRSLRHLPYRDANGDPDAAHVRSALSRLEQTDIPAAAKAAARRKLVAAAKELGIETAEKNAGAFDILAHMAGRETRDKLDDLTWALREITSAIMGADMQPAEKGAALDKLTQDFSQHLARIMSGLAELAAAATPEETKMTATNGGSGAAVATEKQDAAAELAAAKARIAELEKQLAESREQTEKAARAADPYHGMPQEVVERLKAQDAEIAELRKRSEEADAVDKARRDYPNVPGTAPESLGPLMLRVEKHRATPADVAELVRLLKAGAEFAKNARVFDQLGHANPESATGAEAELAQKTKAMIDANPGMARVVAEAAVLSAHPDIRRRLREEGN